MINNFSLHLPERFQLELQIPKISMVLLRVGAVVQTLLSWYLLLTLTVLALALIQFATYPIKWTAPEMTA